MNSAACPRVAPSLLSLLLSLFVGVAAACDGPAGGEGEGEGAAACGLEANTCDLNTLRFCDGADIAEVDCGDGGGFCSAVTLRCEGLDAGAACDDTLQLCDGALTCLDGVCTNTGGDCEVAAGAISAVCDGVCFNDCDGAVSRRCGGDSTVAIDCDAFAEDAAASCLANAGVSACLIPFEGVCSRGGVEDPARLAERCNGVDLVCALDNTAVGVCALADAAADIGNDGCSGPLLYLGEPGARTRVDCASFGYGCSGGQCVGRAIGEPCGGIFDCGADSVCIEGACRELVGSCDIPAGEFTATCSDVACDLPAEGVCDGTLNHFCNGGVKVESADCVAYAGDAAATCAVDDVLGVTGCQIPDGAICMRVVADFGDYFEVCASDAGVGCVEDEDGIGHCLPAEDCVFDPNVPDVPVCEGNLLHAGCLFSGHSYDIDCTVLGATCEAGACVGADEGRHCNSDIACDAGLACVAGRCAAIEDVCPVGDAPFRSCEIPCTLTEATCAGDDVLVCGVSGDLLLINCDASGASTCTETVDFAAGCAPDVGGVCTQFVTDLGTYFGICTGDPATTACVEDPLGVGRCTTATPVPPENDFCNGDFVSGTLLSGHVYNIDCTARGATCVDGVCVGVDVGFGCGESGVCDAGLTCNAVGLCE
jgi:hypothetical protein